MTELGPDSAAPGVRIVWEAKEDKRFDLSHALEEIDEARRNRQAQIGVFVFSKRTAPADLQPFGRYGRDVVVVWHADDCSSDVYLKAAYAVGRALAIRDSEAAASTTEALKEIELATRAVEKHLKVLEEFQTMGGDDKRSWRETHGTVKKDEE